MAELEAAAAATAEEVAPTTSAPAATEDEEESYSNALRENIGRKGNNAYYYAHGHRNNAPAWDGDAEPKLLEKAAVVREQRKLAITKYSWLDEDVKIRIYIPIDESEPRWQKPGAVTLECTDKSLTLVADLGDEVHTFAVPALYDKIESGAFKVKANKIVVTLKKPKDSKFKWYDLKK